MKTKPLLIFSIVCLAIFSCKKNSSDSSNDQLSEAYYKAKLEHMVSLTRIPDTTGKHLSPMKFKSFKEMYNAFKFIETGQVFTKIDSVKGQKSVIKSNAVSSDVTQSTTYTFTFAPVDAAEISGSFGGQLNDLYRVTFSAGYTLISAPNDYEVQGLAAVASSYTVTYGGPAAITSKSSIITPGTYGGNIKSVMQGSGVIDNNTYSITVNSIAGYNCAAPPYPSGTATCTHTLSGSASGVAGDGGGGGNPPN